MKRWLFALAAVHLVGAVLVLQVAGTTHFLAKASVVKHWNELVRFGAIDEAKVKDVCGVDLRMWSPKVHEFFLGGAVDRFMWSTKFCALVLFLDGIGFGAVGIVKGVRSRRARKYAHI